MKKASVEKEDYDQAERLKLEIETVKTTLKSRLKDLDLEVREDGSIAPISYGDSFQSLASGLTCSTETLDTSLANSQTPGNIQSNPIPTPISSPQQQQDTVPDNHKVEDRQHQHITETNLKDPTIMAAETAPVVTQPETLPAPETKPVREIANVRTGSPPLPAYQKTKAPQISEYPDENYVPRVAPGSRSELRSASGPKRNATPSIAPKPKKKVAPPKDISKAGSLPNSNFSLSSSSPEEPEELSAFLQEKLRDGIDLFGLEVVTNLLSIKLKCRDWGVEEVKKKMDEWDSKSETLGRIRSGTKKTKDPPPSSATNSSDWVTSNDLIALTKGLLQLVASCLEDSRDKSYLLPLWSRLLGKKFLLIEYSGRLTQ